jgi:hypothetical protein
LTSSRTKLSTTALMLMLQSIHRIHFGDRSTLTIWLQGQQLTWRLSAT